MDSIFRLGKGAYFDFSIDLQEEQEWNVGTLSKLKYLSRVSTISVEPVAGLLAVGTSDGIISLSGRSAVTILLEVPGAKAVKHLQFSIALFKLVCIDDDRYLHVWDLNVFGKPKLQTSEKLKSSGQCMMLSPCHEHAFLAGQSGKITFYDLLCMQLSPHEIQNQWKAYELKLLASGIKVSNDATSLVIMDILHHPRDLNLVFIAYAGGVVLYDFTKRATVHHYHFTLHSGSPGGLGYNDPELFHERYPQVSALTVHPSGHFFAVGHVDGCIVFWSIEDEDKPLLVRTITDIDSNIPDNEKLAELMHTKDHLGRTGPVTIPEPIFKINWSSYDVTSDPRGGPTTFTVLGGLNPSDTTGVTVFLLPAFAPTSIPDPSTTYQALHPTIREQMRVSLFPLQTYFYATNSPVQDFLLIPRNNPHFSGTLDPIAIALVLETAQGARYLEALEFPPSEFSEILPLPRKPVNSLGTQDGTDSSNKLAEDLASTLQDMQLHHEPKRFALSSVFWSGAQAIMDGDLVRVEKDAYNRLVHSDGSEAEDELPLQGGVVFAAIDNEAKFAKYQPHRLLMTYHNDLSIRFRDISLELITASESGPLKAGYPAKLSSLNIELLELLSDPVIARHQRNVSVEQAEIQAVQLTDESAECTIVLKSGHILIFRHSTSIRTVSVVKDLEDAELLSLTHLPSRPGRNFQASLLIDNPWGAVSVCEMSNIGFLAIAYTSNAFMIVDMRGPRVMLREGTDFKSHKRRSSSLLHYGNTDGNVIKSMKWVYCGFDEDSATQLRLLASSASGLIKVYSLFRNSSSGLWTVDKDVKKIEGMDEPLRRASYVINSKTGSPCNADQASLASAMRGSDATPTSPSAGSAHCFLISLGAKGAKCIENLAGRRVAKIEWGKNRTIENAEIVYRSGSAVLVALTSSTETREALVHSLPTLEQMHTFKLPSSTDSVVSLDDTGGYVDWTFDMNLLTVSQTTLSTLFDIHRPRTELLVDFTTDRPSVPAQPQPASLGPPSLLGSFFTFQRSITGAQLDALLAGPDRPPPPTMTPTDPTKSPQWSADALLAQSSRIGSDLYSRLAAAVTERGEALSELEDRFQSLEEGSKSMVSQAKRLATEQTGKQTGRRWFSNLTKG